MNAQYPAVLIVVPLIMAFVVAVTGALERRSAYYIAALTLAVVAGDAVLELLYVLAHGPYTYKLGGWDPPMGIVYHVDTLSGLVLVVMSVAALINLVATKALVEREHEGKVPTFYTLYLLAVCGHMGMVVTGDAFNLYVLLEIAALSGYALLGMGGGRAAYSTLNYLFIGTIGATFYLLGVGFLYIKTGSLNMLDIASLLPGVGMGPSILAAFGLIFTGVLIKMAFFPLHSWLPNAYSAAPTAASSLIAPMTTKVMVYVMIRMILTVFTPDLAYSIPGFSDIMVVAATVAIAAGAFMALAARDLKRMLTFIIISEVGYMVGGAWLGNKIGMTGAILHIANDAAMTLAIFLAVGCMIYRLGSSKFEDLQGLFPKMPFTMAAFAAAAIAMIGVPPTCGFFSKWYLLLGGITAGHYEFVAALIFSSLVNVVLFFRIFEICFFEPMAEHGHGEHGHAPPVAIAEAPVVMVTVTVLTAAGLIVMGLYTSEIVGIIEKVIPAGLS